MNWEDNPLELFIGCLVIAFVIVGSVMFTAHQLAQWLTG